MGFGLKPQRFGQLGITHDVIFGVVCPTTMARLAFDTRRRIGGLSGMTAHTFGIVAPFGIQDKQRSGVRTFLPGSVLIGMAALTPSRTHIVSGSPTVPGIDRQSHANQHE